MKSTKAKLLGAALFILLSILVTKAVMIGLAIMQIAAIYTESPFDAAIDNKLVADIQTGHLKPNAAGVVRNAVSTIGLDAYVTRSGSNLFVLVPSYMEHDSNTFSGYLFTSQPLIANKTMAYGPVRAVFRSHRASFLMHLATDHKIDAHWYHVNGELYK